MAVHGGSLITLDAKEDPVLTPTVTRPYTLNGRNESEAVKSDREEDIKKSVESGDVRGRGGGKFSAPRVRAHIRSRELISGEEGGD